LTALVTINGEALTVGEVLTMRVAMESLISEMSRRHALGADAHGEAMRLGYLDAARKVRDMLLRAES
jgi:hypothetical protein